MIAIEVEFLNGISYGAQYNNPKVAEFPPHPSKLFAALVAAYEERGLGTDARSALEWLETQDAPWIYANPSTSDGRGRDVHTVFVPTCYDKDQVGSTQFPAFTPDDPHLWYIWSDASDIHAPDLQRIAENVTYLGTSMSHVRVRVHTNDSIPTPTLKPDPNGRIRLRTPSRGWLKHLEEVYEQHKVRKNIQPGPGRTTAYSVVYEPQVQRPASIYHDAYVFRIKGVMPSPDIVAKLSSTVRNAILSLCSEPIPDIISGHNIDGTPIKSSHMAITPLLDVGHLYADGHVMGFAIWMPETPATLKPTIENAIAKLESLTMGRLGRVDVQYIPPSVGDRIAKGLAPSTYTQESDTWASVTPVVFGKHPRKSQIGPGKDGGKVVAELCDWIGLPRPVEARIGSVSAFRGVPMASEFAPPEKYAHSTRHHIWLRFAEPVRGAVLIGAGQYSGFGLCRPWSS
jgi:CRISPR-associated protein Csb2